ncbi:MAG: transcription termination factor NusA [Cytophagales bacterium]|nr:transcription termination factor NusA [Cytophagales bacterium]
MRVENDLLGRFAEYANEKNISQEDCINVFKKTIIDALKNHFGDDYDERHFNVVIDFEANDIQIVHYIDIVKQKDDDNINTISLSEAKKIEKDFEVGEVVVKKLSFDIFSRGEVGNIQRHITRDIKILQQQGIYKKYSQLIGELISTVVYRFCRGYMLVQDSEKNNLILPYGEQIPGERLKKNSTVEAVVKKVVMDKDELVVVLSRTGELFIRKLLELEVPEIADGIVLIKKIARVAGRRSKVVIESVDVHIDAVGACIGTRCSRLNALTRKVNGEIIDFVQYSTNLAVFVARVLGVKKIEKIKKHKDGLFIYVTPEEMSMAIGHEGINIRLLSMLLGQHINVFPYKYISGEDIAIDDAFDTLEPWIITIIKDCGFDTIKDICSITPEEFEKRTDLEVETVENIYAILKEKTQHE